MNRRNGFTQLEIRRLPKGNLSLTGFTLIEVLFVIALMAVLLAAMYPFLRAFHISWQDVDRRADIMQNARIGMDKMIDELRWAGGFSPPSL